jgi:cell migration-inducing and hyaluronan-binding protein
MSRQYRSFIYLLTVSAVFLSSISAGVEAAQVKATRWSDRATWPNRKLPAAGDKVTIESGKEVILDVSPPALGGLTINGKLSFADTADLELTTEWIMVHGELEIGTEAAPHTHKAIITLTDNVKNEQIMGMGDRGIMLSGGTLNLHGDRTNAWTKLAKTAMAGSDSIDVLNASGWQVGDEIVLASTDFDPRQAERRAIAAISGNKITLDRKLAYMHFGQLTFDVDERGEVGLLTRNIKIQASADAEQTFFGGHIMAMVTSRMFVEGVELNRMGQNLTLARYPIHWHLVGDAQGQYIRNASIHDTYNRCVTVHGTHNLQVGNNVTYNTVGHCFFLEDGIEHGNQFVHNLAIQTKCHTSKPCDPTNLAPFKTADGKNFKTTGQNSNDVLIPSDNTVSSFWITNPDNIYRDNIAAGSDATGFWLAFPEHPTGAFEGTDQSKATWPRRTALREFKGNVSHSNFDGFMTDRGPRADGHFATGGHTALANPADANSPAVETVIENFTSYKNRNSGMWTRGEMHTFKNLKLADNAIGYTHASGSFGRYAFTSQVLDSLFVGETQNIGNPQTPAEVAYGRSLPEPDLPDFPIRGYEFYDYLHHLDNVTFVNYQDNATRKTGAISYLLYTSFGMSSNNSVERAKFINAKPVYFPPIEHKWSNDDYGNGTYLTSVFHDKDGTVGGAPNAFILINNGIAIDEACEIKPSWNAAVCKGDIGRLDVANAGIGTPPRLPGARPAAAAGAGGPPGPAGFGGFGAGGPPQAPVVLSRNGKESTGTSSNIRAGTEVKVTTARQAVFLNVTELDKGSWVIVELPGFTAAASGTEQSSLDALRKASDTSYYKGKDSLWVKVVSAGDSGRAGPSAGGSSVQVSR